MTASAERVMKAETFPDDCLELVLDVRVMQSILLGEDQSGFTAERFFFLSRSDGGKGGTAEGMGFDLLQDHIVMCL
jgi:hypothetical protein